MSDGPNISEPETRDTCAKCGKAIPALPLDDAFCVKCRYSKNEIVSVASGASEFDVALVETPAPDASASLDVQLLEALADCGCVIPSPEMAIAAMQPILEKMGDERAAHVLWLMLSRLKGKKGEEIKIAMLGTMGKSLADCADDLGITKQTLSTNILRLKRRIFGKTSDGPAISE